MDLMQELEKIVNQLSQEGIEYAVCGGMALAIWGHPRSTLDIDMLVEHRSIIRLSKNLKDLGFHMNETIMPLGEVKICRFYRIESSGETLVLDILFIPDSMKEVWESRQEVIINNNPLVVVSPKGLISLKLLRNNLQDKADIEYLSDLITKNYID
jgi:hypothetical protein